MHTSSIPLEVATIIILIILLLLSIICVSMPPAVWPSLAERWTGTFNMRNNFSTSVYIKARQVPMSLHKHRFGRTEKWSFTLFQEGFEPTVTAFSFTGWTVQCACHWLTEIKPPPPPAPHTHTHVYIKVVSSDLRRSCKQIAERPETWLKWLIKIKRSRFIGLVCFSQSVLSSPLNAWPQTSPCQLQRVGLVMKGWILWLSQQEQNKSLYQRIMLGWRRNKSLWSPTQQQQ